MPPGCRADRYRQLDLEQQEACYVAPGRPAVTCSACAGRPGDLRRDRRADAAADALGIEYEVVPGVSSFSAAAASQGRTDQAGNVADHHPDPRFRSRRWRCRKRKRSPIGRASRDHVHLPVGAHLKKIVTDLRLHYPDDTRFPVTLVYAGKLARSGIYEGTLGTVLKETKRGAWNLTTMLLVGAALGEGAQVESTCIRRISSICFGP